LNKSFGKRIIMMGLILLTCLLIFILATNLYIISSTSGQISDGKNLDKPNAECIIVLGARVYADGSLSPMLRDRIDEAIRLYEAGYAPKILMSGDNSLVMYNEVYAMKKYAVLKGVPKDVIFMDHAGFSTYDSIYRAKAIFQIKSAIIVTQRYHLYRAIYIADSFGLKVLGVNADPRSYAGQTNRDLREILARVKDFVSVFLKPEPKFLGDPIPISGTPPPWE
jgi:SanA protein